MTLLPTYAVVASQVPGVGLRPTGTECQEGPGRSLSWPEANVTETAGGGAAAGEPLGSDTPHGQQSGPHRPGEDTLPSAVAQALPSVQGKQDTLRKRKGTRMVLALGNTTPGRARDRERARPLTLDGAQPWVVGAKKGQGSRALTTDRQA